MTGTILSLAALVLGTAAAPVMVWLWAAGLIQCRRRRALRAWTALFLAALALLTLGSGVLAALDLAWRSRTLRALYGLLFLGGAGAMLSAVRALPELPWPEEDRRRWRGIACGACCAVLLGTLVLGRWVTALTAGPEQVAVRDGQQVVAVDEGWMDYCMAYYPYRGPLVRGGTALEVVSEYAGGAER